MSDEVGRKVAGSSTVVRAGDPGPTSSKGKGRLEFVAPDFDAAKLMVAEERLAQAHHDQARRDGATDEQIAAVERAGGKLRAPDGANPAAE